MEEFSWPHVHVEVSSSRQLVPQLSAGLRAAANSLTQEPERKPRGRITGGKVGAGALGVHGEVEWERSAVEHRAPDDGTALDDALDRAMNAALEKGSGVIVTVDELHTTDRGQLGLFGAALQRAAAEDAPLVVVAAALPNVRDLLREQRGQPKPPTYFERADWHHLGHLPDDPAREALARPALDAGRPLTEGALDELVSTAGGYPFALQVAGQHAWRAASRDNAEEVTLEHAVAAQPSIRRDLENSLYTNRWDHSSPVEREYLITLATLESPARNADVARAQGKEPHQTTYLLDRLTRKGTIVQDPGSKDLSFLTPGMGQWLRDKQDNAPARGPEAST